MKDVRQEEKSGLCMGCGTCAGVCPLGAVEMVHDQRRGVYVPRVDDNLCNQCGLCYQVCPGHAVDIDALDMALFGKLPDYPWLGNYIQCYLGHATDYDIRFNATSGGLVTTLLIHALEEGMIDGAIVTRMRQDRPLEPQVFIARTPEEIIEAARSKYCPVPANAGLREVMESSGRYAAVGLPCHVHGIRKAQQLAGAVREKVVLVLGLVCSNSATFLGTEYYLMQLGIDPNEVTRLDYRGRGWVGYITVRLKSGEEVSISKSMGHVRVRLEDDGRTAVPEPGESRFRRQALHQYAFHRAFVIPRCLVCCDQTAELADLSFGDARLPETRGETAGKSLVVSRTGAGENLLRRAESTGKLELSEVTAEQFVTGCTSAFKRGVGGRYYALKVLKQPVPEYRTAKLAQPGPFRYLGIVPFLPSYLQSHRAIWPLLYPLALLFAVTGRMKALVSLAMKRALALVRGRARR